MKFITLSFIARLKVFFFTASLFAGVYTYAKPIELASNRHDASGGNFLRVAEGNTSCLSLLPETLPVRSQGQLDESQLRAICYKDYDQWWLRVSQTPACITGNCGEPPVRNEAIRKCDQRVYDLNNDENSKFFDMIGNGKQILSYRVQITAVDPFKIVVSMTSKYLYGTAAGPSCSDVYEADQDTKTEYFVRQKRKEETLIIKAENERLASILQKPENVQQIENCLVDLKRSELGADNDFIVVPAAKIDPLYISSNDGTVKINRGTNHCSFTIHHSRYEYLAANQPVYSSGYVTTSAGRELCERTYEKMLAMANGSSDKPFYLRFYNRASHQFRNFRGGISTIPHLTLLKVCQD